MKKYLIIFLAIIIQSCSDDNNTNPTEPKYSTDSRGGIESFEKIDEISQEEMQELLGQYLNFLGQSPDEIKNSIEVYRVKYYSIDEFGNPATISGVIIFPEDINESTPLLSYQHGTVVAKHEVPIYDTNYSNNLESYIALYYASTGYIVCMSDYLGLGYGTGLHPFLHETSLATSTLDMIRATKNILEVDNNNSNNQIFLVGYSEGGYATMAAQKLAEANSEYNDIIISKSIPIAGPYNLAGSLLYSIRNDIYPDFLYYIPYIIYTYSRIYPNDFILEDILKLDIAQNVPTWYDGNTEGIDIEDFLPERGGDLFQRKFIEDIVANENHAIIQILEENTLLDWAPEAPMTLIHCGGDNLVDFQNSIDARQSFNNNGVDVDLIDPGNFDHFFCAPFAVFLAGDILEEYRIIQ